MKTCGAWSTRTVKIGPYFSYQCSKGGSGSWESRCVRDRLKLIGPGGYRPRRCASARSAYTRAKGLAVTGAGAWLDTVLKERPKLWRRRWPSVGSGAPGKRQGQMTFEEA